MSFRFSTDALKYYLKMTTTDADIEWVKPAPLVPTVETKAAPNTEPLDPAAYLHTLEQQTSCCAGVLDDYINKIQDLLTAVCRRV